MWDNTPLILASQYQREEIGLYLIENGADINLLNEKGCSAILHSCLEGLEKLTLKLLENDVIVDIKPAQIYCSILDKNVELTPIQAASISGNIEIFNV